MEQTSEATVTGGLLYPLAAALFAFRLADTVDSKTFRGALGSKYRVILKQTENPGSTGCGSRPTFLIQRLMSTPR